MLLQRYYIDEIYSQNGESCCFSFHSLTLFIHTHKHILTYITLHPIDSFISTNMLVSVLTEIGLMWQCQSIAMKEPIEMIHKWISLKLRSIRFLSILRAFTNAHTQTHTPLPLPLPLPLEFFAQKLSKYS